MRLEVKPPFAPMEALSVDELCGMETLKPELVVEVTYDRSSGERFRHGTEFVRWRPDKAPRQCTMNQLKQKRSRTLALLLQPRKK